MAATRGREDAGLKGRLRHEPHRFDFFQAVRLLERLGRGEPDAPRQAVGADGPPEQECVRFRALPSLTFPAAPVAQVRQPADAAPEMAVTFLGLTGPAGALPSHYTAQLMRRLRLKDTALRDWLDQFNHRLVSLFYRAWEKYRLPFSYERSRLDGPGREPDGVTQALHCLVGRGTAGLRGRQEVPDEALVYYGGHFAHHPRSTAALEGMLAEYFALPVRVLDFVGQWLPLERDDRTRLPGPRPPRGLNCRLGDGAVAGTRVWDVQGKFRLRIGPLTYRQFRRFFPVGGNRLRAFCQMVRSYVGPEFAFDLKLVLRPAEVPRLRLGGPRDDGAYLGWNTWAHSRPFSREAEDVVLAAVED
jgi:type VI secretion system protein ImpH